MKYVYQEDGSIKLDRRTELPMLREPGSTTPCHKCEKVPSLLRKQRAPTAVMREAAGDLTDQHRQAWTFYRMCRTVNQFPDDPLTRHFAVIFRDVEQSIERYPLIKLSNALEFLIPLLTRRH